VETYGPRRLDEPDKAYEARKRLAELFLDHPQWKEANSGDSLYSAARELLNSELLYNVRYALVYAQKVNTIPAYEEYLRLSHSYLDNFRDDTSSYNVNWWMAKTLEKPPLQRYADAYDEYLAITRHYHKQRNVHDAAFNAIVMAQRLLAAEAPNPAADTGLVSYPLSPSEEKLVAAFANYVDLFADDSTSAEYLFSAGGIFFNHRLWSQARERFQKLVEVYPQSQFALQARLFTMDSYFAEKDFGNSEAEAKTILALNPPPDIRERAQKRVAEAVYSQADLLKTGSDPLAAAREFQRVAEEAPEAEIAAVSLYNAGIEYRKGEAWTEAAEVFLKLADNYHASEYADQALRHAAYLFLEQLKDLPRAGSVFERLAVEYPRSRYRRDAMANAGYCYQQSKDWESTLRVNNLYLQSYPDAEDANSRLFENAGLLLKLERVEEANAIYQQFAARFPDDPRTVQAYFERGQYYLEQGDTLTAEREFRNTVQRNRELTQRGKEANPLFAARALAHLVDWVYDRYAAIRLELPATSQKQQLEQKKQARAALLDKLYELIAFGSRELFRARFLVGAVHENFAQTYQDQEIPAFRTEDKRISRVNAVNKAAVELFKVAVDQYVSGVEELNQALADLKKQKRGDEAALQSLDAYLQNLETDAAAPQDSLDRRLELVKSVADFDSTLMEGAYWVRQCRQKVPELMVAVAGRSAENVHVFYDAPDHGQSESFRLTYRSNVLKTLVSNATQEAVAAYQDGILRIDQVGLANVWKPRLTELLNRFIYLLPQGEDQLFKRGTREIEVQQQAFLDILSRGEDYVSSDGLVAADVSFNYSDMIANRGAYFLDGLNAAEQVLTGLETTDFAGELVPALGDTLLNMILQVENQLSRDLEEANVQRDSAWARYEQTASFIWEDAYSTFDDASFDMEDFSRELLLYANDFIDRHHLAGPLVERVWFKLAQLDPATFGDRFGITSSRLLEATSNKWKVSNEYSEGYVNPGYDDSAWFMAMDSGDEEFLTATGLDSLTARPVWWRPAGEVTRDTVNLTPAEFSRQNVAAVLDTVWLDSTRIQYFVAVEEQRVPGPAPEKLWFRHAFVVDETVTEAQLWITADDDYSLFFNGEFIDEDNHEGLDLTSVGYYDVSDFARTGENVIAVEALDPDGTGKGVIVACVLKTIPVLTDDIFERKLQEQAEKAKAEAEAVRLEMIYERNQIIY